MDAYRNSDRISRGDIDFRVVSIRWFDLHFLLLFDKHSNWRVDFSWSNEIYGPWYNISHKEPRDEVAPLRSGYLHACLMSMPGFPLDTTSTYHPEIDIDEQTKKRGEDRLQARCKLGHAGRERRSGSQFSFLRHI